MRTVGKFATLFGAALIVAAAGTRSAAQDLPDRYAQASLSGPLSAISRDLLEVHGVKVRLGADTLLKGVNDKGRIVDLKPADLADGLIVTVFLENQGSLPVALAVYRGDTFLIRGTVSGLQAGKDGYVNSITVDDRFQVDVRDADAGGDSDQVPPQGAQTPDDTVEVGDEIALQGMAVGGALHAVFVRVVTGADQEEGQPEQTPIEVRRHPSNPHSFVVRRPIPARLRKLLAHSKRGFKYDKSACRGSHARLKTGLAAPCAGSLSPPRGSVH